MSDVRAQVVDSHETYMRFWARAGYAARGVVYSLIGGLAVLAAMGPGGRATDSRGALETLLTAPFGTAVLTLVAIGLVGYSVWRTIQAVKDPDGHGTDPKGLAIRAGLAVSAVTHLSLAYFALQLITAIGGNSADGGSRSAAGWLLNQPFGPILVGCVGLAFVGAGIAHGIKGWEVRFDRYLEMPPQTQAWAYPLCRFGLMIRGLALVIIGGLFIAAGYQFDPSMAGGVGEMFHTVRGQPYGTVLFAIVAVGLLAFGMYSMLEAVYRRVEF